MNTDTSQPSGTTPQVQSRTFLHAMDRALYPITLGYTAVIFAFQLYEFFKGGTYASRVPWGDVYLALLGGYAAQREGAKWLGADESIMRLRRGELFIGLWFALYLALAACANLSTRWSLPQELKTITLGVLGIFAATGVSASLRQASRKTPGAASPPLDQAASDRRVRLIRLLNEQGPLTSEEVAARLGISQPTAWRSLEDLVKTGNARQSPSSNTRERRYEIAKLPSPKDLA